MDGLIIRQPWINLILQGEKTWELRGTQTHKRGRIALIQSQSGLVLGECDLVDCILLDKKTFEENKHKHQAKSDFSQVYKKTYAWVLTNPKRYQKPISYTHPQGAVIWVKNAVQKETQEKLN